MSKQLSAVAVTGITNLKKTKCVCQLNTCYKQSLLGRFIKIQEPYLDHIIHYYQSDAHNSCISLTNCVRPRKVTPVLFHLDCKNGVDSYFLISSSIKVRSTVAERGSSELNVKIAGTTAVGVMPPVKERLSCSFSSNRNSSYGKLSF